MKEVLKNRQFVLLFAGRLTTNAGDSLYFIGAMWLAYELTGSSFFVGMVGFLVQAPTALQFLFGPLADRWDLKRMFVGTQLAQGVLVLLVPVAALLDFLSIAVLLFVVPMISLTNQLAMPAYQAALPRIVEDENLTEANSLFSSAAQGLNAVFNGISGLMIAVTGAVALFLIDSITFFVAVVFLGLMIIPAVGDKDDSGREDGSYVDELRTGFEYLRGSLVLQIAAAAALTNFGYGAVLVTLPEFADAMGGPTTYGLLNAAVAGGSFVGALGASAIGDVPYGKFLILGYLSTGASILLALLVPGPLLTACCIFLAAVALGAYAVLTRSMMQSVIDNRLLGRVMSLTQSMYDVMVPVGSIVGGAFAAALSPSLTFYALAALYFLNVVYFLAHPVLRSLPRIAQMDEELLNLNSPA